jgi:hypothetical protein
MSEDENGKTVEQVAREIVHQHGSDAVSLLRQRAEQSEAIGDKTGARAWRHIADLADAMLRDPCRLLDTPAARS